MHMDHKSVCTLCKVQFYYEEEDGDVDDHSLQNQPQQNQQEQNQQEQNQQK